MGQISEKLKRARQLAGLTQEDLADKLGISRNTYVYWERVGPPLSSLKDLEKVLKVKEGFFLETTETEVESPDSLAHRVHVLESVLLVLTTEFAAMKSQQSGEALQTIINKIYKAAGDIQP